MVLRQFQYERRKDAAEKRLAQHNTAEHGGRHAEEVEAAHNNTLILREKHPSKQGVNGHTRTAGHKGG